MLELFDTPANNNGRNEQFSLLQQSFASHYRQIFSNDLAEKTVIILPSLTLDTDMLKTIKGIAHYEERMLCMLMLLRMPKTKLIYLSSVPIDNTIIDYYLHLLPGITGHHALHRLALLSCYDTSRTSLTQKILARPRLIQRILDQVKDSSFAHISCFNVTEYEKELALKLNIPVYGTDPALLHLGTKSGGRKLFRQLGIAMPDGIEEVKNEQGIIEALICLKTKNPALKKAVIKMEDGFSGEGNAIFKFNDLQATGKELYFQVKHELQNNLRIVGQNVDYVHFIEKFERMGGIVEAFIEGASKRSPSVQCRINPAGEISIISTHDQVLGGEGEQIFLGATFPASHEYSKHIANLSRQVSQELMKAGVLGRFSIDFLSVKNGSAWQHYAIEINLRKGGTTHPYLMLQFLTAGNYDWQEGNYKMPNGETRCYFATDNLYDEKYKGLTPVDLINIAICNKLMYDGMQQSGVMFHMIGALSQYGKLGLVCIAGSINEAKNYYYRTLEVLNRECGG